ncbi:MAG: sensor histidine kinase [Velocimicrobium sp.]
MNPLHILLLSLAILSIVFSILIVIWYRCKTRRIMTTMSEMLNAAIQGEFSEMTFDESLLSSVETKLAHYLSASEVSSKNLTEEKMKIKELIADISHQTKTPLANILLYAQLLTEQNLPKESSACVIAMNQQAEKLNFLIGSLIKTSRLETGILTLHPTCNAIETMLESIANQISPKSSEKEIRLVIAPTAETAFFDIKWTSEAIYNIVDNAVKYTPIGGSIHINIIPYELFCRIDITDNGIGIPEEEHAKIFRRFYRSPSVSDMEGVGIGLYLSRQIISGEGGYIKVTSTKENGTTFSVFLLRE